MKSGFLKRLSLSVFGAVLAGSVFAGAAKAEDLIVYTAVEPEELTGFAKAFEAKHPGIKIKWVRDSTGIMTAKLLAEGKNTPADIVWGLAATSLLLLKDAGILEPYAPKGVDKLDAKYVDGDNPPSWVGQRAWIASICVNTAEAKAKNLPIPKSWADLTKPVYKGHIVMPNPASSGTGFLDVSSWIQMWGEEKAWKFMDDLHKNIGIYTHSGSKPCKMAGKGEFPIGVSFAYKGAQLKAKGAPVLTVAPTEGVGWDLESFGLVKGAKNADAAKKFADWSVSKDTNVMYNDAYAVVAYPGVAKPVKFFPENLDKKMIKNDFSWAAKNRKRILAEWKKRYDSKSEPKKK
ncbi:MAG: putative 2-aminoethylphosphonate ABC transporter substrate-binding protein [Hyphomicrobiaceae bacterium]|nr:putative 2-aminoethylphosphonate ABC transporter substrate-binding protein [Hyphomicrobiaceae bacterium]